MGPVPDINNGDWDWSQRAVFGIWDWSQSIIGTTNYNVGVPVSRVQVAGQVVQRISHAEQSINIRPRYSLTKAGDKYASGI